MPRQAIESTGSAKHMTLDSLKIEDPSALRRAAQEARADGDTQHARQLDQRALTAERRQREREAGVKNVGWNFPAEFYR